MENTFVWKPKFKETKGADMIVLIIFLLLYSDCHRCIIFLTNINQIFGFQKTLNIQKERIGI